MMKLRNIIRGGAVIASSTALASLGAGMGLLTLSLSSMSTNTAGVTQANCNVPFNPYAAGQLARASACGDKLFPRISEKVLGNGATHYSYDVEGVKTTYITPPTGFDAATASASQLTQYGIPTPPSRQDAAAYQQWSQMVNNLHFVNPPSTLVVSQTKADTNNIWAGYINTSNEQIYTTAQGTYVEPSLGPSRCSSNSVTFWSGLGGYGVNQLAQDGTALNVPGVGQNQSWSEVLPAQGTMVLQSLYATPGYNFITSVHYAGSNTFSFYMYNFYSGLATSFDVVANGYNGSTAEYIAERPLTNDQRDNLSNFGTMTFTSAYTNGNALDSYGHSALTMVNSSDGHILATPSGIANGDSFSITQDNCN
jgi:hypothetical protein